MNNLSEIIAWDPKTAFGFVLGLIGTGLSALIVYIVDYYRKRPSLIFEQVTPILIDEQGSYWVIVKLCIYSKSSGYHFYKGPILIFDGKNIEPTKVILDLNGNSPIYRLMIPGQGMSKSTSYRKLQNELFKITEDKFLCNEVHFSAKSSISGTSVYYLGKLTAPPTSLGRLQLTHFPTGKVRMEKL